MRTLVQVFITIIGVSIGSFALAGDTPPADFTALKVGWYQGAEQGLDCTLAQFTNKGIQPKFNKRWKKIANNDWWFVASDDSFKIEIRFTKVHGVAFAQVVGINNEKISQMQFTEVLYPIVTAALK